MRFLGVGQPMQLMETPDPVPAPGWVVLRVEAAGLCHSDSSILDGSMEYTMSTDDGELLRTTTPITLGHESAGTVHALGDGVTGFAIGDRVISGGPMIPRAAPGLTIDGGFAQYLAIPQEKLQPIPDGVSFEMAAVATDSIATAYSAVRTTGALQAGETVGVVGLGGLGLSGLRTAVLRGGVVFGVDVNPATFDAARQRGAVDCFTDTQTLSALKPDLVLDFAGTGVTTEGALSVIKRGGRVVVVGMMNDEARVNTHRLILGRQTLRGSFGRTAQDMTEVLDLLADGELQPELTIVAFSELNEAYETLNRGGVVGRMVTLPWQ